MSSLPAMFDLTGKAAFISGASSGIGLHTARMLADAGAAVALAARRVDRLESEVTALRSQGHKACCVSLDVTQIDSIALAWQMAEDQLGQRIDILFNNAGIIYAERFVDQGAREIERIFDTNLKGAFLVAQEAVRRMSPRKSGSIINVASTSAFGAGAYLSSYGASKAGLVQASKIMALEVARRGIRVNVLCPGNMQTEMHTTFQERGFEENLLQRIPMNKIGKLHQLDGATLLLASDAGGYMTGAVVVVDGGQLLSWM